MTTISGILEPDQSPRLRSLEREFPMAQARVNEHYKNYEEAKQYVDTIMAQINEEKRHLQMKNGAG